MRVAYPLRSRLVPFGFLTHEELRVERPMSGKESRSSCSFASVADVRSHFGDQEFLSSLSCNGAGCALLVKDFESRPCSRLARANTEVPLRSSKHLGRTRLR